MPTLVAALRWQLSGRDLTRGICAALRQRSCIEGDAAIQSGADISVGAPSTDAHEVRAA